MQYLMHTFYFAPLTSLAHVARAAAARRRRRKGSYGVAGPAYESQRKDLAAAGPEYD